MIVLFVAKINEKSLSAISLSFPIQKMLIGISLGTSIGINSLSARKVGEKNNERDISSWSIKYNYGINISIFSINIK